MELLEQLESDAFQLLHDINEHVEEGEDRKELILYQKKVISIINRIRTNKLRNGNNK